MRKVIFFLLALASLTALSQDVVRYGRRPVSSTASTDTSGFILLLQVGESNTPGYANTVTSGDIVYAPTGTYWYKSNTNSLETVVDPVGVGIHQAQAYSSNPAFAKYLKEQTGHRVIIVPAGHGGSSVLYWQPSEGDFQESGVQWSAALAYCAANNIPIYKKIAHWNQGANDAGHIETDGYYYYLRRSMEAMFSTFGVERIFCSRVGYSPASATSAESEKVKIAIKKYGFNEPKFIITTTAIDTFTNANGLMEGDGVHYTLKGQNIVAAAGTAAINYYLNTGNKISVTEYNSALSSVTNGTIDLTNVFDYEFSNNLTDSAGHFTMKFSPRGSAPTLTYTANALNFPYESGGLLLSRPFEAATFTIETRLKLTGNRSHMVFRSYLDGNNNYCFISTPGSGDPYVQYNVGGTSNAITTTGIDWTQYHVLKLVQTGGNIALYVDGVQKGTNASASTLNFQWIGSGSSAGTDLNGTIDYIKAN